MSSLEISPELIGFKVCNPARPEWGVGTVLRVQSTTVAGKAVHRVSVQFDTGHRTLVVPPAQLAEPQAGPTREAGWLDTAAKQTLDDQLVQMPEEVREFLGTSTQRIVVLSRLYTLDEDGTGIIKWARSQTGVADPLTMWTRDELRQAFASFCRMRDKLLRSAAAQVRATAGQRAVDEALLDCPPEVTEKMREVLGG